MTHAVRQCEAMRGAASMQMNECNAISRLSFPSFLISCDITSSPLLPPPPTASHRKHPRRVPKFSSHMKRKCPRRSHWLPSSLLTCVQYYSLDSRVLFSLTYDSLRFGCRCVWGLTETQSHRMNLSHVIRKCSNSLLRFDSRIQYYALLERLCRNKQFICDGGCRMLCLLQKSVFVFIDVVIEMHSAEPRTNGISCGCWLAFTCKARDSSAIGQWRKTYAATPCRARFTCGMSIAAAGMQRRRWNIPPRATYKYIIRKHSA